MFCAIKRVQRYDKKCKMQNAKCKILQKSANYPLKESVYEVPHHEAAGLAYQHKYCRRNEL